MDDQFAKDEKVSHEVSPEGPGEGAAGFNAAEQKEEFLGGGGSEKPPEPSKGILNRVVGVAKGVGREALYGLTPGGAVAKGFREAGMIPAKSQESAQPTLKEVSDGFLKYWFNKELKSMAEMASYGLPVLTYLIGSEIPGDIGRGDFRSAAVKGVIAGLSAAPILVKGIREYKKLK